MLPPLPARVPTFVDEHYGDAPAVDLVFQVLDPGLVLFEGFAIVGLLHGFRKIDLLQDAGRCFFEFGWRRPCGGVAFPADEFYRRRRSITVLKIVTFADRQLSAPNGVHGANPECVLSSISVATSRHSR